MATPENIERFADEIEKRSQGDKKDIWTDAYDAYMDVIWDQNPDAQQTKQDIPDDLKKILQGMPVDRFVTVLRGVAGSKRAKIQRLLNPPTQPGDDLTQGI